MDVKVSLLESFTIKPCVETKRQVLELSGLDRISPALLYTIFFYRCSCTKEMNHVERAKKALQKVLVSWFPAAGRFRINEGSGKLEIDCNGEGVTMTSAVTDSTLEDLGRLSEYKACYEKLVPQMPSTSDIHKNPLVVIQITRFACGGLSIGFGSSHSLFDGTGAFNFLASWAHISSGKDEQILMSPNHSRESLMQTLSSLNTNPNTVSIYKQAHVAGIQDLYGIPMQAQASDDRRWETELSKFSSLSSQGGIQLITLCMKKETIEKLKRLSMERGVLSRCSTFDVLCAHIWKARVKALELHPTTNICLQFPVDSRRRIQPPLGQNFSGNAFVLASAPCIAKDLIQEPLHTTIKRIQSAKDSVHSEYIKHYMAALESTEKFFPSMRELTIVTDWMKFPIHALDFGWGKVSSASVLATPVPETAYLMMDLEENAAVQVRVGMVGTHATHFVKHFNNVEY